MFDFDQFLQDLLSEGFVWAESPSPAFIMFADVISDNALVKRDDNGITHVYTPNENDGSYLHHQFRCIGGVANELLKTNRVVCTFS
jgi:hypothetical protein